MIKNLDFGKESREKLKTGIDTVANAVKVTLGARGRNVVITNYGGFPHVTKDGVTVAKSIALKDVIANMGAMMAKQVAMKTVDVSGDGTTTATILLQSIVNNGMVHLNKDLNPVILKSGIDKAVNLVVNYLKENSKSANSVDVIKNIATLSANNDSEIGEIFFEAFSKVGLTGHVTVKENQSNITALEVTEGMSIERGFINQSFVTNLGKMKSEMSNVLVLVTDNTISRFDSIMEIVKLAANSQKSLLIIADDIIGDALSGLALNHVKRTCDINCVKAPSFGEERKLFLKDIAIATGATIISDENGISLKKIDFKSHLGFAESVVSDKTTTLIVGGKGKKEDIEKHSKELFELIQSTTDEREKEITKIRYAKLNNGIAIIKVGGVTDIEMKERKDRFDDALCAVKAAIEEGFVAGGGTMYLKAASLIDKIEFEDEEEKAGAMIIKEAITEPFKQILRNAGKSEGSIESIVDLVINGTEGFNVKTNEMEDLVVSGVIDPTKVVRVALENAASVGAVFLTTECVISESLPNE